MGYLVMQRWCFIWCIAVRYGDRIALIKRQRLHQQLVTHGAVRSLSRILSLR